ncbi:hydrolase [Vibrio ruber]|uniref:Isochorismatase family protein YecD n=1 Tax=Vibrio ruber (strain DSM 16370 / JCM 11486 / BCRC 17186 / CECT 7878 / LMG 23124 / VR1) TaxID=1123498 RepID=A0A1R4LSK6_VIBR1|nr:hydrolase [Vibrio ruber]WNJ95610.1 hydrolase [Vibrio ruber]SJN59274.1 Isochorismatase family protein YecD [Vibrio ruber DSM 16370]
MLTLNPHETALILIDLQQGILAPQRYPYPSDEILARCQSLAARFRRHGATVVGVNVGWSADLQDYPPGVVDEPTPAPEAMEQWMTLADGVVEDGDVLITKRQWGAFTGTALDMQLRRRGIRHLVVVGIATNMGVESTLRHGWELGYNMITIENACSSFSSEFHHMAFENIFPRLARVLPHGDDLHFV